MTCRNLSSEHFPAVFMMRHPFTNTNSDPFIYPPFMVPSGGNNSIPHLCVWWNIPLFKHRGHTLFVLAFGHTLSLVCGNIAGFNPAFCFPLLDDGFGNFKPQLHKPSPNKTMASAKVGSYCPDWNLQVIPLQVVVCFLIAGCSA